MSYIAIVVFEETFYLGLYEAESYHDTGQENCIAEVKLSEPYKYQMLGWPGKLMYSLGRLFMFVPNMQEDIKVYTKKSPTELIKALHAASYVQPYGQKYSWWRARLAKNLLTKRRLSTPPKKIELKLQD